MRTIAMENRRTALRAQRLGRFELQSVRDWLLALITGAPLALLWANGAAFVLGIVYAVVYVVYMAIPSALHLLLAYDALRVAFRRPATVAPWLMGLAIAAKRWELVRKAPPIVRWTVRAAPFGPLAFELWICAISVNHGALKEIREQAAAIAKTFRPATPSAQPIVVEAQAWSREIDEHQYAMCY